MKLLLGLLALLLLSFMSLAGDASSNLNSLAHFARLRGIAVPHTANVFVVFFTPPVGARAGVNFTGVRPEDLQLYAVYVTPEK
ncbi:MAG: hypothetical protein ABJF10_18555 [Chthoniobacter sp.]|uniref:hypothetical protein n=1 Tax=Chthoniobacter sp. TaxID=2510640 RepID=UPI0032AD3814